MLSQNYCIDWDAELTPAKEVTVALRLTDRFNARHLSEGRHDFLVRLAHSVFGIVEDLVDQLIGVASPLDLAVVRMARACHILDELVKRVPELLGLELYILHMALELVTFLVDVLLEMLFENFSGVGHLHEEALHLLITLVHICHRQKRRLLSCLLLFHCLLHGCRVGADSDTLSGLFLFQDYHLLFLLMLGLHMLHTLFHGSCIWADNNATLFGLQT